jgi:ubiquinol-cytochrome c reductase cytochrome b subunit
VGLFCLVAAVLTALGGLAQINPIWLYGPFKPAVVTAGSQPDWYVGWLDGALRVMPPWEIRVWGHTVANPFFPGVLLPGLTFAGLYAWPFLEARFTKDREPHNLLNRPRDVPLRTAIGAGAFAFYTILFLAGANDILAVQFHVAPESITDTFRIALFVVPLLVFALTRKVCRDLRRAASHPIELPVGTHVVRTPGGGYEDRAEAATPSPAPPARSRPPR